MSSPGLYQTIRKTAHAFVDATDPTTPGTNETNPDAIRALCASDCVLDWGHATFVSTAPPVQGKHSTQSFIDHMGGMTPKLETWRTEVASIVVDVEQKSAVVRAMYYMTPKGKGSREERTVLNELLYWFVMDEAGAKIVRSTEFIDPVAAQRIGALIKAQEA